MQPSLIVKAKDLVRLWVQDSSDACLIKKKTKNKKKKKMSQVYPKQHKINSLFTQKSRILLRAELLLQTCV